MEREITITVTDEQAELIEERISAGVYASAADFVHAAVDNFVLFADAPQLSDELVRKLIEEDEAESGPDLDADEVFDRLHRRIDELTAKRNAT